MMDEACFAAMDGRDFSRILRQGIREMGARSVLREVLDGLPDATQARQLAHAPEAYALVAELLTFIGDMGLEHDLRTADLPLMRRARAYLAAVEGRDAQNK